MKLKDIVEGIMDDEGQFEDPYSRKNFKPTRRTSQTKIVDIDVIDDADGMTARGTLIGRDQSGKLIDIEVVIDYDWEEDEDDDDDDDDDYDTSPIDRYVSIKKVSSKDGKDLTDQIPAEVWRELTDYIRKVEWGEMDT